MKAGTWRRRVSTAACALTMAAMVSGALADPVFADTAGLPAGLPELPSLGEVMQPSSISGVALQGYDPVAYQVERRAVAGNPAYEIVHNGAVWRFVSAANREAFRDAPDVYEPAFAGFDASAVAQGRAVDIDPSQFAIVGSRLFLFRTQENRRRFVENTALMKMADTLWSDVSRSIAR